MYGMLDVFFLFLFESNHRGSKNVAQLSMVLSFWLGFGDGDVVFY